MKIFSCIAFIVVYTIKVSAEQVNITSLLDRNIIHRPTWHNSNDDEEIMRDLIVGGSLAASQEYGSYAVTDPIDNSGGLCGATLIHPDVLISAAHCGVAGIFNNGVLMNIGGTSIYGADAIDRIEIAGQLIHPEYNSDTISNDVMLIKLSSPSSAPLSTWNTDALVPENTELLTIIGHGKTESGSASPFLLEATVFVVDDDICETAYALSAGSTINSDVVLCASSDESTTCSGDSGGPLFLGGLLVGVVSFGIVSEFDESCISGFPSGFTRISAFSDFISKSICTLSANPPESCFVSTNQPAPLPTLNPSTRAPTRAPETTAPTRTPSFPPLQYLITLTPFTPIPTASPTLRPTSLLPSPFPSTKDSSSPSMVPSSKPSPKPTYQTNSPSRFPTVNPSNFITLSPTSAPNDKEAVTAIEGENRGFGIDVQSNGDRNHYGCYKGLVMGILLHGIAMMNL